MWDGSHHLRRQQVTQTTTVMYKDITAEQQLNFGLSYKVWKPDVSRRNNMRCTVLTVTVLLVHNFDLSLL